jgi:hypothetical protein
MGWSGMKYFRNIQTNNMSLFSIVQLPALYQILSLGGNFRGNFLNEVKTLLIIAGLSGIQNVAPPFQEPPHGLIAHIFHILVF